MTFPKRSQRKLWNTKTWATEIKKNTRKLNGVSVCPLATSAEGVVTGKFLKHLENIGLNETSEDCGRKAVLLRTCHVGGRFRGHAPWH